MTCRSKDCWTAGLLDFAGLPCGEIWMIPETAARRACLMQEPSNSDLLLPKALFVLCRLNRIGDYLC